MNITPYMLAERFVGTKEVSGKAANPAILAMLNLDAKWPTDDEVPWCSAFTNYIAWLLRLPRSKSLLARSWLDVGTPVDPHYATQGFDVVILTRPGNPESGHVGFFSAYSAGPEPDRIYLLGGNQSDSVSVVAFDFNRILGIRRLA